jgi:hypothetical protein
LTSSSFFLLSSISGMVEPPWLPEFPRTYCRS